MQDHIERGRLIVAIRALEAECELSLTRDRVDDLAALRLQLSELEDEMVSKGENVRWIIKIPGHLDHTCESEEQARTVADALALSLECDVRVRRSDALHVIAWTSYAPVSV